jgi:hypothetical protein
VHHRIGRQLTYANVMATVAVFLALGGGAYAVTVKKNSVKTSSIKDGAVTKPKLGADVNSAFLPASAASGFLPASAASTFLSADAASKFAPNSSVRRIAFFPTGCNTGDEQGCTAGLASFSGGTLNAGCANLGVPTLYIFTNADEFTSISFALIRDSANPEVDSYTGTNTAFMLSAGNAIGTIVIGVRAGEEITIPFHAYSGAGVNCAFEGTATRA